MRTQTSLLTLFCFGLLSACATVEDDWIEAKRCGSSVCMATFLSGHPNSKHQANAEVLLKNAKETEANEAPILEAWKEIGASARSSTTIDVKSRSFEKSCRACATVEQSEIITVTTETPSIFRINSIIANRLRRQVGSTLRIDVDRFTESKLRVRAHEQ